MIQQNKTTTMLTQTIPSNTKNLSFMLSNFKDLIELNKRIPNQNIYVKLPTEMDFDWECKMYLDMLETDMVLQISQATKYPKPMIKYNTQGLTRLDHYVKRFEKMDNANAKFLYFLHELFSFVERLNQHMIHFNLTANRIYVSDDLRFYVCDLQMAASAISFSIDNDGNSSSNSTSSSASVIDHIDSDKLYRSLMYIINNQSLKKSLNTIARCYIPM